MGFNLNYSGFVVAGIGFVLTRFTVALAIYEEPFRFYLAGVAPLALGLGLAAFGVALAVADVDPALVRTTATWCVIGFVTMLVLAALTLVGTTGDASLTPTTARTHSYLSNFLIGGSVGGTLTGLYASRNRQQRTDLEQQTTRLVVLNHMLRHKILNALTPIRGFATAPAIDHPEAEGIVKERTTAIEQTVEDVRYYTERARHDNPAGVATDLAACISAAVEEVHERYPDVQVSVGAIPSDLMVRADDRLGRVITNLLENAIVHANDESPSIEVTARAESVRVDVVDSGPGLPEDQQILLESGQFVEHDRLDMGFGLDLVRLFAESYSATIETEVTESGTRITLVLPRPSAESGLAFTSGADDRTLRPAFPHLIVTLAASLAAGVIYGVSSNLTGGSIAGIGIFYGTADPVVGWITHEFHSVVFGFVFVSLLTLVPTAYQDDGWTFVAVGIGWSLVLWIGAAGIIAPIWLRLIGISANLPNITLPFLINHLAWGVSLGVLTAWGFNYVVPRLASFFPLQR